MTGTLREVVVVEAPVEFENDTGEREVVYRSHRGVERSTYRASITQSTSSESASRGGVGVNATFAVEMRPVPGLEQNMRLRWKSRGDRLLYISGILERGTSVRWLSLTCEERAK